jgi:hypothetical protein
MMLRYHKNFSDFRYETQVGKRLKSKPISWLILYEMAGLLSIILNFAY